MEREREYRSIRSESPEGVVREIMKLHELCEKRRMKLEESEDSPRSRYTGRDRGRGGRHGIRTRKR